MILPMVRDPRFITIRRGGPSLIWIIISSLSGRHSAQSTSFTSSSRSSLRTHDRVDCPRLLVETSLDRAEYDGERARFCTLRDLDAAVLRVRQDGGGQGHTEGGVDGANVRFSPWRPDDAGRHLVHHVRDRQPPV